MPLVRPARSDVSPARSTASHTHVAPLGRDLSELHGPPPTATQQRDDDRRALPPATLNARAVFLRKDHPHIPVKSLCCPKINATAGLGA